MAKPFIQNSFHAGEFAPALNARVDLAKYHAACALAENFFVDYRGGLSTRQGTRYILKCLGDTTPVRVIPFQASFATSFVLEFGNFYIRFYQNGAPVLLPGTNITNITQGNPAVVTDVGHGLLSGRWIFISGVNGMTQINEGYYIVSIVDANHYALLDIWGNNLNSTGFSPYASAGTAQEIYTLTTPYAANDLALLKYTQNVAQMIICHSNYPPQELLFTNATTWTLSPFPIGTSVGPPTLVSCATTLAVGMVNYSYVVTGIGGDGEESVPSNFGALNLIQDLRTVAGTNFVGWTASPTATGYNIYKAQVSYSFAVPVGAAYGYIGSCTGTTFVDANIEANFAVTPPIGQNPFSGAGVISYTVTVNGTYTTVPSVTVATSGGLVSATANAILQVVGTPTVGAGGTTYSVGDTITLSNGVVVVVNTVSGSTITSFKAIAIAPSIAGAINSGPTPANPVTQVSTSGSGSGATVNLVWGVGIVVPVSEGAGYTVPPAVSFSPPGASATAVLGASNSLNPSVPAFFQQRLFFGGLAGAPQTFFLSQTASPNNFNVTNPIQADNAISAALVGGQLNSIKSAVPTQVGLIVLTDKAAWMVAGSSTTEGVAVSPSNIAANPHSYNGASDVMPVVCNYDILYVQAKGSVVRDLTYNIYANIWTGTDISVLSSHLFYGYHITQWAWAEEPFKTVWACRSDGALLTLTFLKEQELMGWCHSVTPGGFESVATVTETASDGSTTDAIYFVVDRLIDGVVTRFIERLVDRTFPNGYISSWSVDAGIGYDGAPQSNFAGAIHLKNTTCVGVADGQPITVTVSATGTFTIPVAATVVTIGLQFTPKFQTLQLDVNEGEATIQGRPKSISSVTVRVENTLGLSAGKSFSTVRPMKDLQLGNVGSASNQPVDDLVTGDAFIILEPQWDVPGQYCITQPLPYPATILGVIPEITIGPTPK